MHQAGEAIAAVAVAFAAAAEGQVGLIEHDAAGGVEGMKTGGAQVIHQLLHAGFMGHRRMGIGAAAGRLGGILTALAVHVIHLFRLLVPGLEIGVAQWPGWRGALEVGQFFEVLLAQAEVGGAIPGAHGTEGAGAGAGRLAAPG